jgi:Uma2 family endonuclease
MNRGKKFVKYRSIPTLREYLIIARDRPLVEQWELTSGHWTLTEWRGGTVRLHAVPSELPFEEIYRNVKLW